MSRNLHGTVGVRVLLLILAPIAMLAPGCRSTKSQMLLLEAVYDGEPTNPRERIPAEPSWDTTTCPAAILRAAGLEPRGRRSSDAKKIRKLDDPGTASRKALTRLQGRDVDGWRRSRALAVFAYIAREEANRLTRALALNSLVEFIQRREDPAPIDAPGRPLSEKEVRELLATLQAIAREGFEEGAPRGASLDGIPRPAGLKSGGARAALFLLSEITRNHPERKVRRQADTLSEIYSVHTTLAVLLEALEDPFPLVREDAARGLGILEVRWASRELATRLLEDTSPAVRRASARALGELLARDGIDALIQALERPREQRSVVLTALESLRRITGENPGDTPAAWRAWRREAAPSSDGQSSRRPPAAGGGDTGPS